MEHHSNHHDHGAVNADAGSVRDPVCGMRVDPRLSDHRLVHEGTTYYFCSAGCLGKFRQDPGKYLSGPNEHAEQTTSGGENRGRKYTCPMHPEIVRDQPGDCPICGMALEPMGVPAGEDEPNEELIDFRQRFRVGAVLTVPLLVLTMGPLVGMGFVREALGERAALWSELVLATPVILWSGWPFLVRGAKSIVNRSMNMFTLISMGVGAAYIFSVVALLAPGIFPEGFRSSDGHVGVYFEAGAVIVVLVLVGQLMELGARDRTGAAIRALLDMAAKTARVVHEDGSETEIALEDVKVGDRLRIRPG
ncbi:MAG: YHS domain-containing protein, partial [Pseudomonadales bacterium]|nr:YHS domain-containing protein [Pseudomonadales bacterium]